MERPAHMMFQRRPFSPRIAAVSGAFLLEAAAFYAVATGLVFNGFHFPPRAVQVEFYAKPPEVRPVVLPQLRLVKPPTPIVPQPDIQIQIPKPPPRIHVARMHPHAAAPAPVQMAATPAPAPPAPPKPKGITAPVSIGISHNCGRAYPAVAQRLNQQGITTVRFTVNTDGSVSNVRVVKSSGHEMLDDAATGCASAWRYRPALENGQPVPASWTANVQWRIRNGAIAM
jgi:protein TonB